MLRSLGIGLLLAACLVGCDTVEPVGGPMLVVEGFLDAGEPLPVVVLRRTHPLAAPYADDETTAVTDGEVHLTLDGATIPYRPVAARPGHYAPADDAAGRAVPAGATFVLEATWGEQRATASGTVPPPITIDSVRVEAPPEPVPAVLLDSLYFTDSLGVVVQKGFIYPVEVTLWWTVPFDENAAADSLYWIETQLRPYEAFASGVGDFFLRPEQILRERTMPRDAANQRHWTGVYAVPVATRNAPLPAHRLKVSLLRSGRDYARFASSRDAPGRREPVSNVRGALGIVAGIAVDSVSVRVGE